jgi:hypothetical protein
MNYDVKKLLASAKRLSLRNVVSWDILEAGNPSLFETIKREMYRKFANQIIESKKLGIHMREVPEGNEYEIALYIHDRPELQTLLDEAFAAGQRSMQMVANFGKNPCCEIPLTGPMYCTLEPEVPDSTEYYHKMYTQRLKDAGTRPYIPPRAEYGSLNRELRDKLAGA